MEAFLIIASVIFIIIAVLSIMYKPDMSGWARIKILCRERLENYTGENEEEIRIKVEEIYYWCDLLDARKSYFMMRSNAIVANRIAQLHSELIQLGFFDDKLEKLIDADLQRINN